MESVQAKIQRLKTEKNAVILAHYYVPDEVQSAADFVGDSFYLAKVAAETKADVLVSVSYTHLTLPTTSRV